MSVLLLLCALSAATPAGVLEGYVQRPDNAYAWMLEHEEHGLLLHSWFLRLDSQRWLDETRIDRTLWTHQLRIVRPRGIFCGKGRDQSTAMLLIAGGKNKADAPHVLPPEFALAARIFCRTLVEIRQIPNQPLTFAGDAKARREDALIARSFDRFLAGTDADLPAQTAMVKAVVRAMDAAQDFAGRNRDIPDIRRFVLLGSSKRGWTAWLTAAVDPRVRAVIPVSIDLPGLERQMPHHVATYGDYVRALQDYKALDIGCRMNSARGRELLAVVDPAYYYDRLQLPKLIINSAGDEFFASDAARFYFSALPGEKRLRYTPNTDHRQHGIDRRLLLQQASGWVDDILAGRTPPRIDWQLESGSQLVVTTSKKPRRIVLWTATNPDARDFRRETLGAAWQATELRRAADGSYRVTLDAPARGWRARFVEAEFGGWRAADRQVYTTEVFIRPDMLPFPADPCAGKRAAPAAGAD
ncbi:MAG: PhoPQ-activated protein PqaA family protein [Pseudomonadota bacterium]